MPRIHDNPDVETDRCHTPLEHRRREEMKIRRVHMGFFRVATEPLKPILCLKCKKDVTHISHSVVNSRHMCWECKL